MKIKISGLLFAFSVILLLGGCDKVGQQKDKTNDILQRATSYFNQGQYSAASIEAKNALQLDGKNVDANVLLARIYFQQGMYAPSSKILLALPQDNLDVVILLGDNYLRQSKYKSLTQLLDASASLQGASTNWDFVRLSAIGLIYQHKYPDASKQINLLDTLANTPEQKASTEVVKSYYFGQQNMPTKRMEALDQALAILPGHVDALLEKAKIKFSENAYEAAEDLLSQALIALPRTDNMTLKRLEVLQAMASTLSRQNRTGEAMIYSKLIADANPKAQEMQSEFDKAVEKLKSGDVKSAEDMFSKLYLTDHAKLAGSMLGLIKYTQGDFKEASQYFEDTIDPETASPELLKAIAESQLRTRNPEQALMTIESNILDHPDDPDLLAVYGLALLSTGEIDKGIEHLKKALAIDPGRTQLRAALATAYNSQKRFDAALAELQTAYKASPTDSSVQEKLASQLVMMKKPAELKQLASELEAQPSVKSKTLAGLLYLQLEPKKGAQILDALYQQNPDDLAVLKAQLRKSTAANDNAAVIKFGKILTSLDPNDLMALGAVSAAYAKQGKPDQAKAFLEAEIKKSANSWGPEYILAAQNLRAGKLDEALVRIDSAATKSTYNGITSRLYNTIYQVAANQAAQQGDFARARELVMSAMQNNEVTPQLQHMLVKIEIADKNLLEAEKVTNEMGQSAPGTATTYYAQGDLAKAKGNASEALDQYYNAWALAPSDVLAAEIWSSLQTAPPSKKKEFLDAWQDKLPNSFRAKTMAGVYAQETGSSRSAVVLYKDSLALNGNQPVVLNNLGWLLMEQNKLDEAYQYAEKAAALTQDVPSILDTFGWIAFKAGKKDVAIANLEKAAALAPDNAEIQQHLQQVRGK